MWLDLLSAIGLLLVLEGIMPFLSPRGFREALLRTAQSNDASLRFLGLTLMLIGLGLLYWIR